MLKDTELSFSEFCDKGILTGKMRYEKYRTEGFATPSGKFELYAESLKKMGVSPLPIYREPVDTPVSNPSLAAEFPLILTTGAKVRVFFHSEGRQMDSLRKKNPDPLVEIHPETAADLGIEDNDWVRIETPSSQIIMRARCTDTLAGMCALLISKVSAQHGWWFPEDPPPEYGWKKSCVNRLFGKITYDPDTGSESLRSTLCRIHPVKDPAY